MTFDDNMDAGSSAPIFRIRKIQSGIIMSHQGNPLRRTTAHDDNFHASNDGGGKPKGKPFLFMASYLP